MRDDMDFFYRPHYRLNKRLLFYLGQWPLQTQNERIFYRTTTVLIVGSILIPEVIKFIKCLGNLKDMIECLPVLGIHFRSVVRFVNSTVKATTMKKLTNRIKDDWTIRTSEFDETILKAYAERGRQLTVVYTVYLFSTLGMFLSLPLIPIILDSVVPLNQSRDRVYLFQSEYFVDQDEKYYYIMLHACVSMPFALAIIIGCDTMYAVYVHHVCGIFATLGVRLQNIQGTANNDELEVHKDSGKRPDKAYDDIVACIKIHNEAVEVAKLIESSCCISLIFVVGASVFTTTITGFMTVTNLDQPGEALRYAAVAIGDLIHLFYLCWQGHMLAEHSEDIFINAYNVDWCDMSPRAKKLLILIMFRSFEPCKLTAGKIFVLSMQNYASAVKTTMSYFTVLLSMQ